jgi:hypothetical protein
MDTVNSILFLAFCGITSIAMLIILNLLLPGKVERITEKLEDHYVRSFVIGFVALGFLLAILLLFAFIINLPIFKTEIAGENMQYINLGQMPLPGILTFLLILLALGLTSISAIGLAALAKSLGQRIGKADQSFNPYLSGATFIVLSALAPFLGWFIFAPVAIFTAFGSTVQAIFKHKTTPKVVE